MYPARHYQDGGGEKGRRITGKADRTAKAASIKCCWRRLDHVGVVMNPASSQLAFIHSLHHSFLCLLCIKFCAAYLCHLYTEQSVESQTTIIRNPLRFCCLPHILAHTRKYRAPIGDTVPRWGLYCWTFCWYKICQMPALEKRMSLCYNINSNFLFIKTTRIRAHGIYFTFLHRCVILITR